MTSTFDLYSWECRRYRVVVETDTDPTSDTVEFAVQADDGSPPGPDDPSSWTAGSWVGSYDATADEATAQTPTFGTSESSPAPDVQLVEGTTYRLMARVRNLTDAPGDVIATLRVL
jgi:hypothetical protein